MSQVEANELARRNYALEAWCLGEEQFLQIRCADEVIATVCEATGRPLSEFVVFNGIGMGEDDEEDDRLVVKRFPVRQSTSGAWRDAVRFAYAHALSKLMIADQRSELEDLELAA